MLQDLRALQMRFEQLGVREILCKQLAENDNSKQQVYLGGNFDVLQMLPFENIETCVGGKKPNYKAHLQFYWLDASGQSHQAPHTQLILYPQYPEVRLSGFLQGCKFAPNELMRPIPGEDRQYNKGPDGRLLFLGVAPDRKIYAFLAPASSLVAAEFLANNAKGTFQIQGVFKLIQASTTDTRVLLLKSLRDIHAAGWHSSIRLNSQGLAIPYLAKNGGGYTLEALLGIIPNGRSEPDFMGWEIKGHSSDRITLMTPEPDAGFYGEQGVQAFVRRFGRPTGNDTLYFTGLHKVGQRNATTGLTLMLDGYNPVKRVITNVSGAVHLLTDNGMPAATWTFEKLLAKWNRKHAQAAYVGYESNGASSPAFHYKSPVHLGQGTDFIRYLDALHHGAVVYDPASKVTDESSKSPKAKARSQFRISFSKLAKMYKDFGSYDL